MDVRAMQPQELDAVIRLWHETSTDTYGFIAGERGRTLEDRARYFAERIAPHASLWVADATADTAFGEIVGFMALRDTSYVDRLYVLPRAQRRGVGSLLLAKARELSPGGLELHTHQRNAKACAFYEKHGFRAVRHGLSPAPENEPDVEYHWRPASV